MTLALSSRTKLHVSLAVAVLTVVGSAALSTPASAAKQSTVLGACKNTAGCWTKNIGGGQTVGCSYTACFACKNGSCHSAIRSVVEGKKSGVGVKTGVGNVSSTSRSRSKSTLSRGATAPVKFAAPGNSHMRTGGRH